MFKKQNVLMMGVGALMVAVAVFGVSALTSSTQTADAAPRGISNLKLFNELEATTVETTINNWLAAQSNIVIDSIDVDTAGSYQIAIGYHPANVGAVVTRVKLFQYEGDGGLAAAEAQVNNFLNGLTTARNVRALDVSVGTGAFPATFVLYD